MVFYAAFFILIVGVESASLKDTSKPKGDPDWWKHAVFYQIYPRSFKDSDNDGIGDLQGIISKLGHLKDAGVTATWLSPIYKSPQVDQGYDISDFMDIDKDYGTLKDFDELVEKAHNLGIKIVMDFVPNHSSNEHEWFLKSENRTPGYEDLYVWKDGKDDGLPNNWLSRFKYSAWEWSEIRQQYYYHQFAIAQPDLNYRSPVLVQNMKDVIKFWLDRGVDGFRMDAVPYLFEHKDFQDEQPSNDPNTKPGIDHDSLIHEFTSDQPDTFDMIYQWREFVDEYTKENGGDARIMMTEAYTDINNTMLYYGDGERDGAHFTFNFQMITKLNITSNANDIVETIKEWLEHKPPQYTSNWVLGNHDNPRVATKFGPKNQDGFNMLLGLLPGVMVNYNGEEIGQENGEVSWKEGEDPSACNGEEEDFNKTSRDFERTPFHWDNSTNAGFNTGYKPWLPVSSKYKENNLADQKAVVDSISHYQVYKNIVKLRKEPTLLDGDLQIEVLSDSVFGFVRTLEGNPTYVYLFNIGDEPAVVEVNKQFSELTQYLKVALVSSDSVRSKENLIGVQGLTVDAHECIIATTTTEKPGDGDGAVRTNIAFFVLFITVLCTTIIM